MGNYFGRMVGVRFHPTDYELVVFFLKKKLLGEQFDEVIGEINIYDFEPSELSAKSILRGEQTLYFFCPRLKKYSSGFRLNRTTKSGYWKSTGKDKEVEHKGRIVGMRKTLIFHVGRNPDGTTTNWVMHEYKILSDADLAEKGVDQEAYVVCKVYKKSGSGPKNGEQYGAADEFNEWGDDYNYYGSTVTSPMMIALPVNHSNISSSSGVSFTSSNSSGSGPSTVTSSLTVYGLSGILEGLDLNASSSGRSTIISSRYGSFALVPANNTTQEVVEPVNQNYVPDNDPNMTSTEAGPSTVTSSAMGGLFGATGTVYPIARNAGASTLIPWEIERRADVPVNNTAKEVEDPKGKKVMTGPINEDVSPDDDDINLWLKEMLEGNANTSDPSTLRYQENERHTDVPDINNTREVENRKRKTVEAEDPKGKKVMTEPVDDNDVLDDDYVMVSHGDDDSMSCNNDARDEEDSNGMQVTAAPVDENDTTSDDFASKMFHFDDFPPEWVIEDKFVREKMADDEHQK